MITVDGLTTSYGRIRAIDDLSFEVHPGRVTGFVGPNGAGRATTMRAMVGLAASTAVPAPLRGIGCSMPLVACSRPTPST